LPWSKVGLGGRLDATHAWDGGVAAITNVDLDHTDRLGATVEANRPTRRRHHHARRPGRDRSRWCGARRDPAAGRPRLWYRCWWARLHRCSAWDARRWTWSCQTSARCGLGFGVAIKPRTLPSRTATLDALETGRNRPRRRCGTTRGLRRGPLAGGVWSFGGARPRAAPRRRTQPRRSGGSRGALDEMGPLLRPGPSNARPRDSWPTRNVDGVVGRSPGPPCFTRGRVICTDSIGGRALAADALAARWEAATGRRPRRSRSRPTRSTPRSLLRATWPAARSSLRLAVPCWSGAGTARPRSVARADPPLPGHGRHP